MTASSPYREKIAPTGLRLADLQPPAPPYDPKANLSDCHRFFSDNGLLKVSGIMSGQQYQRSLECEGSLKRLYYLDDICTIKKRETELINLLDLPKLGISSRNQMNDIFGAAGVEFYIENLPDSDRNSDSIKTSIVYAGAGASLICLGGYSLFTAIAGAIFGLSAPIINLIWLSPQLREEESAVRQLKAMIPSYAEKVAQDIQALPEKLGYLENLCSDLLMSSKENSLFTPERELTERESKEILNYFHKGEILANRLMLLDLQGHAANIQVEWQEKLDALRSRL